MKIKEIRKVNIRKEKEERMAVVKLRVKEGKREVMANKKHWKREEKEQKMIGQRKRR